MSRPLSCSLPAVPTDPAYTNSTVCTLVQWYQLNMCLNLCLGVRVLLFSDLLLLTVKNRKMFFYIESQAEIIL